MIERLQDKPATRRSGSGGGKAEELPYRVELRDEADGHAVERVLARAFDAVLARTIFRAVQAEHPGRRILLCRSNQVIDDSAK